MNRSFKNSLNSKMFRITSVIAIASMLLLVGVVVAQNLRNQAATNRAKDALVQQIKGSPDYSLAIYQDDDTPLKIVEATVKEISSDDYEKLTAEKPDRQTIISAPTAKMVNVSDKTITRVMFTIFDDAAQRGKGIYMRELTIRPGQTFMVYPENFVKQEPQTTVDEKNRIVSTTGEPMKSKKAWMPFADKSQVKVRVAVDFEDGTKWFNRSQRGEN